MNSRSASVTILLLVIFLITGLVGCSTRKTTSVGLSPERLAVIGVQIDEAPNRYREILSYYDVSPREFENALREVTQDVQMSRRYSKRFNRLKERYRSNN